MATFSIDSENNITAHGSAPGRIADHQCFSNESELLAVTAEWPVSRLMDIWNGFAGVVPFDDLKPVRKFTNRAIAVSRIFKAIQRLSATVAQPARNVASAGAGSKKSPAKRNHRRTARTSPIPVTARTGSKKAEVIELMSRKSGAGLEEIAKITGWQFHTIRGFVSGQLVKKNGLEVQSFVSEEKGRSYRIVR